LNEGKTHQIDVTATLACLGTLVCWALGPIFIKYLTDYIDSWTQNLLRYAVGCLFWLPFLLSSACKGTLNNKVWRRALVPAIPNVVMQSLWAAAFYYLGPAFLVLLSKTSILWIAGFSLIFFQEEKPLVKSKRFWFGLLLSITGVVGVLYFKEDFRATGTSTGVIIALATAFAWGAYTISAKIAFRDIDSRHGFAVISIYTVLILLVLATIFGNIGDSLQMGPGQWGAIIFSGITAIAIGHALYYAAIKRVGATIPMLVILAQPFAVFAISRVVFGETMNGLQIFFGMILLAGSAISIWAQQHLKAKS